MSKRFGRKQKRHLRDRIKNLELLAESERVKANIYREKSMIADSVIEMIRSINPNFPALKHAEVVGRDCWRVTRRCEIPLMDLSGESAMNEALSIECIDLYQLEADLVESDDFMRSVTFSASITDSGHGRRVTSCLRASREALRFMGVSAIALDLARHLKGHEWVNGGQLSENARRGS